MKRTLYLLLAIATAVVGFVCYEWSAHWYEVVVARQAADQFEHGNFADAEKTYDEALAKAPANTYLLSNKGVVLFREQKYELAEQTFKKAIAIDPKDDFSRCTLGIVNYQQDKLGAAINTLAEALRINPKNATAHNYLGIALSKKGFEESARKELEAAIGIDPNYADAHFNLAVVLATQTAPDKKTAGEHYTRARKLGGNPDDSLEQIIGGLRAAPPSPAPPVVTAEVMDLARVANDQFERGNFRDAEKIYDQALAIEPNNGYLVSNKALVLEREQKYQLAGETGKTTFAIAAEPKEDTDHCALGIAKYQQGKLDEAINELTKALAINPKNATAHNFLGIIASKKGWDEAAKKELETAISLDPTSADMQFNLAIALANKNPPDKKAAREHYERALKLGAKPDSSLEQLLK